MSWNGRTAVGSWLPSYLFPCLFPLLLEPCAQVDTLFTQLMKINLIHFLCVAKIVILALNSSIGESNDWKQSHFLFFSWFVSYFPFLLFTFTHACHCHVFYIGTQRHRLTSQPHTRIQHVVRVEDLQHAWRRHKAHNLSQLSKLSCGVTTLKHK